MVKRINLKQLHRALSVLLRLERSDLVSTTISYERDYLVYVSTCAFQNILTERILQFYGIPFPSIPNPPCLFDSHVDYEQLQEEFEELELSDCLFSLKNLGIPIYFLGVDMADRETSLLSLPHGLQDLIRKRWVFYGADIMDTEMDMVVELKNFQKKYNEFCSASLPEWEMKVFKLCLEILPVQNYYYGPVILCPGSETSGYIHFFFFCSNKTPFTSLCYISRAVFLAVYALHILCTEN